MQVSYTLTNTSFINSLLWNNNLGLAISLTTSREGRGAWTLQMGTLVQNKQLKSQYHPYLGKGQASSYTTTTEVGSRGPRVHKWHRKNTVHRGHHSHPVTCWPPDTEKSNKLHLEEINAVTADPNNCKIAMLFLTVKLQTWHRSSINKQQQKQT